MHGGRDLGQYIWRKGGILEWPDRGNVGVGKEKRRGGESGNTSQRKKEIYMENLIK